MLMTTLTLASVFNSTINKVDQSPIPMLKIERLAQVDNIDHGDIFGANRADFYLEVYVNGKMHKTDVVAKDDADPDWMIPLDVTTRYNKITIKAWDDDGGLERQDDHVDISPEPKKKNLSFTYDRFTGRIWGDVKSYFNKLIVSEGKGDDDKGRIEFRITKIW